MGVPHQMDLDYGKHRATSDKKRYFEVKAEEATFVITPE
jgi:hypothetical protein